MSVWLITGISRGLGRSLALAALHRGHTVVGTTRTGATDLDVPGRRLHVLPLELTDPGQTRSIATRARELAGGLDVVVNNAGYGLLGAVEEATAEQAAHVFDVNFFGPMRIIQAVLPHLRAQGHGHLVNIASIAALDPRAGSGLYAAAKAALVAVSEALAEELGPLGIGVTAVEPGSFRTEFLTPESVRRTSSPIDDYAATSGLSVSHLDTINGHQPGDPDRAAQIILDAVSGDRPPEHLVLGADALDRTRANVHRLLDDLNTWETASVSTAFSTHR
ncbi:SDR family NAD(P)-dependent oxidoreductase [Amycolatopsis sp. NBC_00345]|uniref:SDR family NAD(P)-dependent oxidoreductase n=1 Tax=Amycolatopsis sp. NBC_00345 TaxID=2975955 RepID=UPI002E26791D